MKVMEEVSVETGVDDLIALLKSRGKLGIKEAADELKIGESFVQAWVDFLVEENIIGVEYKFTKPYIFLNATEESLSKDKPEVEESVGLEAIKKDYLDHAENHHIPQEKALLLWEKKLREALEKRKEFFYREAQKRNLNADQMYAQYVSKSLQV